MTRLLPLLAAALGLAALPACGGGPADPREELEAAVTALSGPLELEYEASLGGGEPWRARHRQLDPETFRIVVPTPTGDYVAGSDGTTFWAQAPGDPPQVLTLDAALLPVLTSPAGEAFPVALAEVDAPGLLRNLLLALARAGRPLPPEDIPTTDTMVWEVPASALPHPLDRAAGTARVTLRLDEAHLPTSVEVRRGDEELYRFVLLEARVPEGFPPGTFAFVPPPGAELVDYTSRLAPAGVQEALSSLGY